MFVDDLPEGGRRLRRPAGGYRYTAVAGQITQEDGTIMPGATRPLLGPELTLAFR